MPGGAGLGWGRGERGKGGEAVIVGWGLAWEEKYET